MEAKTCEEYVLQELSRLEKENSALKEEINDYRRMYNQSETENDKLRMQLRQAQEVINSYQK